MPFVVSARANRFMRMGQNAHSFSGRVEGFEQGAARIATETSRLIFSRWHSGRPNPPVRPGRSTTMGSFATMLTWTATGNGLVTFETAQLSEKAPYWIIQEIGTGETAIVWKLAHGEGEGIAVKTQIGRRLPRGFYWGDEGGANPSQNTPEIGRDIPSPFRSLNRRVNAGPLVGQQNLFPIAMAPPGAMVRQARGRIHREIIGKHFVRDGGAEGFRVFREEIEGEFKNLIR